MQRNCKTHKNVAKRLQEVMKNEFTNIVIFTWKKGEYLSKTKEGKAGKTVLAKKVYFSHLPSEH